MLSKCLDKGILTTEKNRRYSLLASSLGVVLKAYATENLLPYELNFSALEEPKQSYYLTYDGLQWLYAHFRNHSVEYLQKVYTPFFITTTKVIEQSHLLNNFRGETGKKPRAGSKQPAILVYRNKRVKKEYHFETIHEARDYVVQITRQLPLDQFTLYRIRKLMKKGKVTHYREEIPLIVDKGRRGQAVNLPHLKG